MLDQLEDINTREREHPVILLLSVSLKNQRRNAFKSSIKVLLFEEVDRDERCMSSEILKWSCSF